MKYIFFIAAFNAFFFLGLLLKKKPRQLHDNILIFWLLYLGISTGSYSLTIDLFPEAALLSSLLIALFLLHGPFMYLYVTSLASSQSKFQFNYSLHFLPFIAFVAYLLIAFQFPDYAKNIHVSHTAGAPEPPPVFIAFLLATALSGPVYFFFTHKKYRKLKKSSHDFTAKEINIRWLGKLITIFGIVWTMLIIIAVIHHVFHLFSMIFCTNGLFLSLSVFIILIGYYGLRQKEVFVSFGNLSNEEDITEQKVKYATSRLEGDKLDACFVKVETFMKAEKPYLNPDLTLPKLAEELDVSTHHLSQVINERHGSNFFDYINRFRVEEVKRKIASKDFQNYTLLGIAMESGFNSKSAFNRVFKQIENITPGEYRKSL